MRMVTDPMDLFVVVDNGTCIPWTDIVHSSAGAHFAGLPFGILLCVWIGHRRIFPKLIRCIVMLFFITVLLGISIGATCNGWWGGIQVFLHTRAASFVIAKGVMLSTIDCIFLCG